MFRDASKLGALLKYSSNQENKTRKSPNVENSSIWHGGIGTMVLPGFLAIAIAP